MKNLKAFGRTVTLLFASISYSENSEVLSEAQQKEIEEKIQSYRASLLQEIKPKSAGVSRRTWTYDQKHSPRIMAFEISSLGKANLSAMNGAVPSYSIYHGYIMSSGLELGALLTLNLYRVESELDNDSTTGRSWTYGAGISLTQHRELSDVFVWSPTLRARWIAQKNTIDEDLSDDTTSSENLLANMALLEVIPFGFTLKSDALEVGLNYGLILGSGSLSYEEKAEGVSSENNGTNKVFSWTGSISARYRY